MIYELRTYTFAPGGVAEFQRGFSEALPHRNRYSRLGAFWRTEFGPLNQALHVWPYESLAERDEVRAAAAQDEHWPPRHDAQILEMNTEILLPAPFMQDWDDTDRTLGNVYEMRIYTYRPGTMPRVIEAWSEAIEHRLQYSPLAAAWYTEIGALNRWIHVWPYESLAERDELRPRAMADPHWPPPTREWLVGQEVKLLVPADFSPMR